MARRMGHWHYVSTCGWHLEGTNIIVDRQSDGRYDLMTGSEFLFDCFLDALEWIEEHVEEYIAKTAGGRCHNCGGTHGDAAEAKRDGSAWWHGDTADMPAITHISPNRKEQEEPCPTPPC